jgi:hypothetical protein
LKFWLLLIIGAWSLVIVTKKAKPFFVLARLRGFEPPTYGLEVRSSIQLSYRRLITKYTTSLTFGQGNFVGESVQEASI